MHDQVITEAMQWVDDNAGEQTTKRQLAEKAEGADLAPSVKDAIASIPEGEYRREELKRILEDALVTRIGQPSSTMRGFGGSM
jgi:hypothetical protein